MASASLKSIYDRINGVSNYHPYTAETFADWSLEAGDIVTVSQDGTNYSSPVHATTVTWNGQQKVSLESNGEKKRDSLAKMSSDEYSSSTGGSSSYRYSYGNSAANKDRDTRISSNEDAILLEAWDRTQADTELSSRLTVTASEISAEVTRAKAAENTLSGRITVQADKVALVVEETSSGGYRVKAAQIVAAINDAGSSVLIEADHIRLSGTTTLNDIMTVGSGRVAFTKPITVESSGNVTMIGATGPTVNSRHYDVTNVTKSGNVLTITYWDGSTETFSKATTLSGAWSGGTYTVTAKQNGTTVNSISEIITGTNVNGTPTLNPSSNKYIDAVIEVKAKAQGESGSGSVVFSSTKTINATAAYNAGYDVGYDDGYADAPGDTKTQKNELYCTGATVQGSGYSNYTFSATLPTGRFSSGNTYTFWRVP